MTEGPSSHAYFSLHGLPAAHPDWFVGRIRVVDPLVILANEGVQNLPQASESEVVGEHTSTRFGGGRDYHSSSLLYCVKSSKGISELASSEDSPSRILLVLRNSYAKSERVA